MDLREGFEECDGTRHLHGEVITAEFLEGTADFGLDAGQSSICRVAMVDVDDALAIAAREYHRDAEKVVVLATVEALEALVRRSGVHEFEVPLFVPRMRRGREGELTA